MYRKVFKRLIDIILSVIALPFFCIIYVFVAPAIKIDDGGTVFYKAPRRGVGGKIFQIYKFRSMKMNSPDIRNSDNSTFNSKDDSRITKIGKILRKTSIDETPQILNVLKGDMSIIGPRPVTTDKPLEEYDEKRRLRLTVRPGITGATQAYYRNSIGQEEKFEYDAQYARELTFWGDVKIFFKTIQTVFLQKGIYNTKNN